MGDILDTHDPYRPDGTLEYNPELCKVFLIAYMIHGVVVLFTFLEAYFRVAMDKQMEKLDGMMVESRCFGSMGAVNRNRLRHLLAFSTLISVSVVALCISEEWS